MQLLAYILKEWDAFVAALENLVNWHKATGSLPAIPAPPSSAGATGVTPIAGALPAGVTYVDTTNGLVKIAAADAVYPGQLYCVLPMLANVSAGSQAYATINYNTATAKSADQGLGLHVRVNTMVPTKNVDGSDGWTNSNPYVWIDNAWSVGSEYATWDAVIAQAVLIATREAKAASNTGGGGGGFVPGR